MRLSISPSPYRRCSPLCPPVDEPRSTLVCCPSSLVLSSLTQGKAPATATHAGAGSSGGGGGGRAAGRAGLPPIVVNLNSSSSELKLLRVLQTLVNLSGKDTGKSADRRFP